jgi:hypothetical protein
MKIRLITALLVAATSAAALAQTNSSSNNALAACLQSADQKYKDTWDALCTHTGKARRCIDFLGSPRDREFSQLRLEEMSLCSKLYR